MRHSFVLENADCSSCQYNDVIQVLRLLTSPFRHFPTAVPHGKTSTRGISLIVQQETITKTRLGCLDVEFDVAPEGRSNVEERVCVPVYLDLGLSGPAKEDVFGARGTVCPGSLPRGALLRYGEENARVA